jgi:hypothetical protein
MWASLYAFSEQQYHSSTVATNTAISQQAIRECHGEAAQLILM